MQEVSEMTQEAAARPCAHCGGPKPPGRGRIYCSKHCKDNAWEARRRDAPNNNVTQESNNNVTRCAECGDPFRQRSKRPQIYCSGACRLRALRAREAEAEEAGWIPEFGDHSTRAAVRRRELIRDLAFRGNSSRQIGERISVLPDTVRRIARELSIAIPADEVVRKTRRHDSDRIIRETAQALEGLVMGVALVDLDDVDPVEAKQWATSLTSSIRVLNRFRNQIKEMTQ
jgi:ferredoxin